MAEPSPRDRLLDAAERLFDEHGFAAVKLRHIAEAAGLHHSTFYHHVPGGKAQLYAEAMERSTARHAAAVQERLAAHREDLRAALRAVASWLLERPPGNHGRMLGTDLRELPSETAERLAREAYAALIGPIARALREAPAEERAGLDADPRLADTVAGALVAAVQALGAVEARYGGTVEVRRQAEHLVDVFLDGLRRR